MSACDRITGPKRPQAAEGYPVWLRTPCTTRRSGRRSNGWHGRQTRHAVRSALRFSPESVPLASSRRASSRRLRASFRLTSGKVPTLRRFSAVETVLQPPPLAPGRRQFQGYRPPPSNRRTGLSAGFALRIAVSESGIEGNYRKGGGNNPRCWPPTAPGFNRVPPEQSGKKKAPER